TGVCSVKFNVYDINDSLTQVNPCSELVQSVETECPYLTPSDDFSNAGEPVVFSVTRTATRAPECQIVHRVTLNVVATHLQSSNRTNIKIMWQHHQLRLAERPHHQPHQILILTAVDFPKEDQQQQQQEQQERQNSQSDSQGLFNKFRSASDSSTFTAVASHPAVDDSAASLTNFYYKSGGELDRFLDSLPALDHCPTVASLPRLLIAAVEANSLGDLIRLLHSPASSAAGACDLNWADEARNGETALTAALRQGNVAAVRLLLQHTAVPSTPGVSCLPHRLCQLLHPKAAHWQAAAAACLQRHCDAVSQALADCAQSALGLACLFNFDIADRLPSLPCVLLLGNALFQHRSEATAAPLVRLRGQVLSARGFWLNNVRQMPLSQAGCFICNLRPAPCRSKHCRAWCQRVVFGCPADGRFRLLAC
uniref:ANK_REP_REGION domain-containing protein n=1 Tax=Macrostomum lignano TaxID=282301 RepID=A0A1I8FL44_9PLAT